MPSVIAETKDLLVLDKPSGLIVHSDGRTEEPSVATWLMERYSELAEVGEPWVSPQGEEVKVAGIVHRLDRTTSGVLLVAKTQELFEYLKGEFKARRVGKVYRAYVHGHMEGESGKIVAEIMRSAEKPRKWYARDCDESDVPARPGRAAITEWALLERLEGPTSYIEVRPKTGRTHQIRVHLAHIGHSLVGDTRYGGGELLGFTRPALHAYSVSFLLANGEEASYEAPLPSDFAAVGGDSAVDLSVMGDKVHI